MANSLNLKSTNHYIFRNLSMIVYIFEIQASKFTSIKYHEFNQPEPDSYIKCHDYFHPVGIQSDI